MKSSLAQWVLFEEVVMRYLVGLICALALVASPLSVSAQEHDEAPKSAALAIHGKSHAPLQLMLRTTYFYDIDVDPLSGRPTTVAPTAPGTEVPDIDTHSQRSIEHYEIHHAAAPTEASRQGGMSRGGKIAVGVVVPLVVAGIVAGAVVMATGFDDIW